MAQEAVVAQAARQSVGPEVHMVVVVASDQAILEVQGRPACAY